MQQERSHKRLVADLFDNVLLPIGLWYPSQCSTALYWTEWHWVLTHEDRRQIRLRCISVRVERVVFLAGDAEQDWRETCQSSAEVNGTELDWSGLRQTKQRWTGQHWSGQQCSHLVPFQQNQPDKDDVDPVAQAGVLEQLRNLPHTTQIQ